MPDFLGFMRKAAPWITAAASGNIPALIGMAAKTVADATGGKVENTVESIASAVAGATPEQLLAIKQADNDFALKMKSLGFQEVEDLAALDVQDRANARNREIQVRDRTPEWGFYLLITLEAAMILALFLFPIPAENKAIVFSISGCITTLLTGAGAYFWGSNRSNQRATELLSQAPAIQK